MSFAQKDRLDRIRHTSLLTTEKNFIENKRKMPILDAFFERQQLIIQPNKNRYIQAWKATKLVRLRIRLCIDCPSTNGD